MNNKSIRFLLVIFLFITNFSFAKNPTAKNNLCFTATDATNWVYVLRDKTLDPASVFRMEKGILQITGTSTGYLRTKKNYKNFDLKLEWRWTKVLGNSGVLVCIQPKDSIWPVCYQVQQKADAAADILCMNGAWVKECTDSVKFTVKKMKASNEKPIGEWNSMRIICKNKTLKVFVNDELQNYVTGLTVSQGYIGFQNEGKPLEFRNLIIK